MKDQTKWFLKYLSIFGIFIFSLPAMSTPFPGGYLRGQVNTIQTLDERELIYYVDRPENAQVPILLTIDGSGCRGGLRPAMHYAPGGSDTNGVPAFARVIVEKAGVDPKDSVGDKCTDEFRKNYTIDKRVEDHFRVLQHLRANAKWWNGKLYIFGWSDGGDIAARITAYYPHVTRSVLGAMGGGITMAEQFENIWMCAPDKKKVNRAECLADLRMQFQKMEDNPTWKETWGGQDNAWRVWPTRLRQRLSVLLKDNQTPILIVHGAKDHDNTPIESARALVSDLTKSGNNAFTYWEVPDMEHTWRRFSYAREDAFKSAMLQWLFNVPIKEGGPADFGKSLDYTKPEGRVDE